MLQVDRDTGQEGTTGEDERQVLLPDRVLAGVARVDDEQDREDEADDGDPTSRANRGVENSRWSTNRHLICAAAEKPYGMAAVMPLMNTRVLNTVIPTEPA